LPEKRRGRRRRRRITVTHQHDVLRGLKLRLNFARLVSLAKKNIKSKKYLYVQLK
jgi:hypothetical protein